MLESLVSLSSALALCWAHWVCLCISNSIKGSVLCTCHTSPFLCSILYYPFSSMSHWCLTGIFEIIYCWHDSDCFGILCTFLWSVCVCDGGTSKYLLAKLNVLILVGHVYVVFLVINYCLLWLAYCCNSCPCALTKEEYVMSENTWSLPRKWFLLVDKASIRG